VVRSAEGYRWLVEVPLDTAKRPGRPVPASSLIWHAHYGSDEDDVAPTA
jgi:hypothetical protein